ncbi:hypothetical protein CY0110_14920 [Crocosphaera chwakensis CCY0110]|uniref:Uncharacterized protein n=1 Tax=Crocosphaera chwakensis CCY0110 TaxID=391612 RepID=A3ITV3_9CHRO|nr:hypothetical protein CY0110_14920 [Crocosphaera chwakensis CCY0110]
MYESNNLSTHIEVFWITSNGLISCYLSLAELDDLIEEIKKN